MKLGSIKSRPDDRDYDYVPRLAGAAGMAPPRAFDGSGIWPPAWHQGYAGTCTMHAAAAKLWELYPGFMASRLAGYWQGRKIEGRLGQEGMQTRTSMMVMQAGIIPETAWPYDIAKVDVEPPALSERRAIGSYARIRGADDLISHIAYDGAVVLSFNVPEVWMASRTFPAIGSAWNSAGWHEVITRTYDMDRGAEGEILCRNSYGPEDGPLGNGYFWMPIDWAVGERTGDDLWTPHYAPPGTVAGVPIEGETTA